MKIPHLIYLFTTTFIFSLSTSFATVPEEFRSPPDSARPWAYWFIMDGNLTKEGITADFEAMRDQGLGGIILMEVNLGLPRGEVDFMSEKWQELFAHIVHETERLGLQLTLNSGPGWTGSGGPWIKPEHSMWHLVASEKRVTGPAVFDEILPKPQPRPPFFGALPAPMEQERQEFARDVCVLAFPTPVPGAAIADVNEKASYVRAPYSSAPGVKPRLPAPAVFASIPAGQTIAPDKMLDLSDQLAPDGTLRWDVPEGEWTILRFAATTTGANTRPAPQPGVGFECSKMDRDMFDLHAANYIDKLFQAVGPRRTDGQAGWCYFHIDSWEMGPQNFSKHFLDEFRRRRGYDPTPWLPAYVGMVVESVEKSERFLWDVRQTAQELIVENHGEYLREVAHRNHLKLSVEPYDMMPCCDMTFGAVADVPMCEFWSAGYGFDTAFSCFEAASVAHIRGKPVVGAEAFTSGRDAWRQNPKSMKQQTDWAFCTGINRITFHRFQHQPHLDRFPGFSMGAHGVHWERTQTWWPMISGYHRYLARCQYLLRRGEAVVDVLYLLPEGAPQVFTPPLSALQIAGVIKDQRGYRFDGCDPDALLKLATVENGLIAFPGGSKYRLLVLPKMETMTPRLLAKIGELIHEGAMVVGPPSLKSPSLQDYPNADAEVNSLAAKIWGSSAENGVSTRSYGKGTIINLPSANNGHESPLRLDGAKWVWFPEGDPAYDAPEGARYFRKTLTIPVGETATAARLLAVADNDVAVHINGTKICSAGLRDALKCVRFEKWLKPGENLVEIEAVNGPNTARNPAGLIAAMEIWAKSADSKYDVTVFFTDSQWEASKDKTAWVQAMELGNFGIAPWQIPATAPQPSNELYPDYDLTAGILARAGVPEDFASPGDAIRFFHRREGGTDYYFLANRTTEPFLGEVTFRVSGKKAAIFDPMTGNVYRTPELRDENGCTKFELFLEGSQAVFVVFDGSGADEAKSVWKQNQMKTVLELNDNWTATFDPKRAGPDGEIRFEKLADWTENPLDAVKYYSGIAVYRKTFEISHAPKAGETLLLDLGGVEVMARVRLNGREVGIRWMAPYQLDITEFLQPGVNTLEIEVANLWPNRLIGDAKLPAEKRTTWTTWNGVYRPDSPLLPSGLLGPVRVMGDAK